MIRSSPVDRFATPNEGHDRRLFAILIAQKRVVPIMAVATENVVSDANEAALQEFEAGLARSIKQYKAGEVEAFDDKEEFIRTLIE